MRIAIDCRSISNPELGEMAGIGHYTWYLTKHLLELDEENQYTLFFDSRATKGHMGLLAGSNRNAKTVVMPLCRYKKFLPYAYSHHIVARAIADAGADVFHAPTGSLPLGYKGKSVITVHDLAIYANPEWFPAGQMFSRRIVVPASVRRADRIIAVSRSTRDDLIKLFSAPSRKISVIHEGVDHRSAPIGETIDEKVRKNILKKHGLKHEGYFLYLGTIEPRKNVAGLVRAYQTLAARFPGLVGKTELVIAGAIGWKADDALKAVREANRSFGGHGPRVRHIGYVAPEEKLVIMAHALAFVFPSHYEGFGLPVLEAMSLGVPVISSNVSSIPEIVGRAGLLVNPADPAELTLAMKHLLEDGAKRRALGQAGLARSTEFRWERTAGETLEVYEAAARAA
jgi:glycosyltransferase involved in cell wall biosynthesis